MSPRRTLPVAALAALLLAGDARAQGTPSPPAAEPPSAPAARTLTLAEALRTALARQPTLAQARAGAEAAEARADQTRSGLLPQVAATASYTRATNNVAVPADATAATAAAGANVGGTSWSTRGSWRFGVSLSQLIWDFGQTSGRWRAAQATAASQRATAETSRLAVVAGVQTAFFAARAGKDLLRVAQETLQNQRLHLQQTEGFVRAGTQPEIARAQARANVANAQVTAIQAENTYLTEKAQLNQAMGVEAPTDYDVGDDALAPVAGEDEGLEPLLGEALAHRPELAALQQAARSSELSLGAARGGYLPSLGFTTSLSDSGYALDGMVGNWSGAVTLTWNLFQGGLTQAQVREASASLDASRAQLEAERQAVRVDVEKARLAVRASRQSLSASEDALASAREQLRLAEARYRTGVGNIIELSDAQVQATTAAAQRVQAAYNLSTSRAQLFQALGRVQPGA